MTMNSDLMTEIHPKLPMRNKQVTRKFYVEKFGFTEIGDADFKEYLMLRKGPIEIHFFEYKKLDPLQNDGQVYIRTHKIEQLYQFCKDNTIEIHPNGELALKPWNQKEFSVLDPDNNLLTFGQSLIQN